MYEHNTDKSNAQKLAETLKRCGLASSVSQAHQMAGEITSTERKVQTFFDQKRQEMKDDHMRIVHPNREEFQNAKAKDIVSTQIENFRNGNSKQSVEISTPPKVDMNVEVKTKEPWSIVEVSKPVFTEEKVTLTIQEVVKTEESSKTVETEDYVNKFINKSEEKSAEETPLVIHLPENKEVKETEKHVETHAKANHTPEPVVSHPKPAQPSIDINNFFNFQKKGKV